KITTVLFLSQSLSSAAFIASFTVNALIGFDLTGKQSMAGVPGARYVVGQACGAVGWGDSMERIGRRKSIALGQVAGVAGSVIASAAIIARSFPGFLFGLILVGMARSAVDLGRFAAAEVHLPEKRGRAISNVVLGSTVGAIFGPLLVGPMGHFANWLGYPELSGAYIGGAGVFFTAALLIFGGLRPDPRDVGRELARLDPSSVPRKTTQTLSEIVRRPGVIAAIITMASAQMVMVVPMSITSVHMKIQQHPLTSISVVISAHTLGMYAFSILSGRMADRKGRGPTIIFGSVILIVSCAMAAPSVSLLPLVIALFLLGLGWNFAYVAGSALLSDQLSPGERSKTQGFNDLVLNFSSGASQVISGVIFSMGGYGIMAATAAVLGFIPLAAGMWWQRKGRISEPANI
ncbi:MAG TPA: MFS transporter, partial [Thermodesulfobacteriota bacterium]|nr:MFS transporter [Thermodesulfobacteriota bacterium]